MQLPLGLCAARGGWGGQPALLNCISEPGTIVLCVSTQCQLSFPGFSFSALAVPLEAPGSAGLQGLLAPNKGSPAPAPAAGTASFSSSTTDLRDLSKNAQQE